MNLGLPNLQSRDILQVRMYTFWGAGFPYSCSKGKGMSHVVYVEGRGLPRCRNSTCHFAAPPRPAPVTGLGSATGAGQAGSSLIPHGLPRQTVVPGGPGCVCGGGCGKTKMRLIMEAVALQVRQGLLDSVGRMLGGLGSLGNLSSTAPTSFPCDARRAG